VGEALRKSEDLHCRSQRALTSLGLPDLDGLRLPDHGVRGQLQLALQLGRTFTPEEALAVRLVDEIVPQREVLEAAEKQMQTWCQVPSKLRSFREKPSRNSNMRIFSAENFLASQFLKFSFIYLNKTTFGLLC